MKTRNPPPKPTAAPLPVMMEDAPRWPLALLAAAYAGLLMLMLVVLVTAP